jgi:hypothetical protein
VPSLDCVALPAALLQLTGRGVVGWQAGGGGRCKDAVDAHRPEWLIFGRCGWFDDGPRSSVAQMSTGRGDKG